MISTGSSIKLSLSSSQSSFIGMTRDSSDKHCFRLEMWKVLWTLLSSLGSSSLYATRPIRSRILKGPMYRGIKLSSFFESDDTFTRLNICSRFGDTWDWVAYEPERQQAAAAGALGAAEDAPTADEGA
ncbi:hypothetical protein Tco_1387720 [Tanacetum coccineum]